MTDSRRRVILFAILTLLTCAVFLPSTGFDFLMVDDGAYILDNPHVRAGLSLSSIQWAFTSSTIGHWHPLTLLSYMTEVSLFGLNPAGFHLTNVLLHLANALLLWSLLYRMTGASIRSWFVAVLFAIHPLHVESVVWIAERKDVLSAFFGLITLHAYVAYARRPGIGRYALIAMAFSLALMSKAIVVTLPCAMLLLDYWPLRRIQGAAFKETSRCCARLVAEKIPLLILSGLASFATVWASANDNAVRTMDELSIGYRLANAAVAYATYFIKTVWPSNLSAFYPHLLDDLPSATVAASIALLLLLSVVAAASWRRAPYAIVGWLWFIGLIIPVSGLFQVGDQAMADRYTYLSLTGIFIWIVWGIADAFKLESSRPAPIIAAPIGAAMAVVVCVFSLVAWQHTQRWRNTITIYEHSLTVTADNTFTRQVLGDAYLRNGQPVVAAKHFETALAMSPGQPDWMNKLGYAYLLSDRRDEARQLFVDVLLRMPGHADAANNLGIMALETGDHAQAAFFFRRVVELRPNHEGPLVNLAIALAMGGDYAEAERRFAEAIEIDPNSVRAHLNLGLMELERGQSAAALDAFDTVLALDPANATARARRDEAESQLAE